MKKLKLNNGTEVALKLAERDGYVTVRDEQGWNLVTFNPNGTITSHLSVGNNQFQLTKKQRIKIVKD